MGRTDKPVNDRMRHHQNGKEIYPGFALICGPELLHFCALIGQEHLYAKEPAQGTQSLLLGAFFAFRFVFTA